MYFVYLLQSLKDKKYYIGQTDNMQERLKKHNDGEVESTRNRAPFRLVGNEEYKTRNEARWKEHSLKKSAWQRKKFFEKFIVFLIIFIGIPFIALASVTDGTIDNTYKYAWSENTGWVNFGCDNCDVHITDSGLSGYALSETIGWINLNNVINDGAGNLSGYAWSENTGYINFNPTNGGVIINSSGEFTGSALSETIGWIVFDNCDYQVKTDWRPQSARVCVSWTYSDWSSCSNGQQTRTIISSSPAGCSGGSPVLSQSCSSGGGGGGLPPRAYNPPNPPLSSQDNPEGEFKIIINNGEQSTNSLTVNLKLFAGKDTTRMSISNNSDFKNASIIPYQETIIWMLNNEIDFISDSCKDIAIYAKFYTEYGVASEVAVAKITLAQETQNQKSKTDQKNFAYSRERLKSLPEEQNTAKELKQELENHYGKNRIPVHKKHWHTIVNSYVYGNYPINAIIQAIKFGGKTVHPSIPFSAWKKAGDYSEWINK